MNSPSLTANNPESRADRWREAAWESRPPGSASGDRIEFMTWFEISNQSFGAPARLVKSIDSLPQQAALAVRWTSLTRMGMTADEVEVNCDSTNFPLDLAQELEDWNALEKLEELNAKGA